MEGLRWVFLDRDSRARSGWAILVFVLVVTVVVWLGGAVLGSYFLLVPALAGTVAGCLIVRQPVGAAGFHDARWWGRLLWGFVIGAMVVSILVGVPWVVGREGLAGPAVGSRALAIAGWHQMAFLAPASAGEEVVLRGFLLQQLARGINPAVAVVVTGALFGLGHLGNENVVWLGIVNIVLVGWWLGLLVVRTRSLWLTIGMHISWNWFEGFVFGQAVSGSSLGDTLLRETHGGALFWTGGPFGPEASGVCTILLVLAIIVSFRWRREPKTARVV